MIDLDPKKRGKGRPKKSESKPRGFDALKNFNELDAVSDKLDAVSDKLDAVSDKLDEKPTNVKKRSKILNRQFTI